LKIHLRLLQFLLGLTSFTPSQLVVAVVVVLAEMAAAVVQAGSLGVGLLRALLV
jgi:hypothetical protein